MPTAPRAFTHYWAEKTWMDSKQRISGEQLAHTAGNRFRERDVRAGDHVYVVGNIGGEMHVAGRMRVSEIVSEAEAKRRLGDVWPAADHVIGENGTVLDFNRPVPDDVVRDLRFGDDELPLIVGESGRLDQQTWRGVRRLTPASASLLDEVIRGAASSPAKRVLVLAESAEDVADSVQRFFEEARSHVERAKKLFRETTYWVHDPTTGAFGPGKFVGYRAMSFDLYDDAENDRTSGARHNGGISHDAIELATGRAFVSMPELGSRLKSWGTAILGPDAFGGATTSKWRFLVLDERGSDETALVERPAGAGTIRGQGFERDPAVRAAIELRAMDLAKRHYQQQGFAVEDTARSQCFDLRCSKARLEVRVEVKGTRGDGTTIELTSGEVRNARGSQWRTDLFLVTGIKIEQGIQPVATRGEIHLHAGWSPKEEDLAATTYRWTRRSPIPAPPQAPPRIQP